MLITTIYTDFFTPSIIVKGAYSTVSLPYNQLLLSATPKYPNIEKTSLAIIPFLSQTTLLIFYAFINYEQTDWGETFAPQKTKWFIKQIPIKHSEKIQAFPKS